MEQPLGESASERVDVLIVGAGLSGIGAACHLKRLCPDRSVVLLEARQASGGTWDLFRYPGVRSDSDMYTLGYSFRPWPGAQSIADGPSILRYLRDTAAENGVDKRIRYGHRMRDAAWSSASAEWAVEAELDDGSVARIRCGFLLLCSGYYDYSGGHAPEFAGRERFRGEVVHPQQWPADIDVAGKRIVVIGSGATAVSLVPELAKTAAHVTMLQRSPTFMVARPSVDRVAGWLRRASGRSIGTSLARWKNVLLGMYVVGLCKRKPARIKAWMIDLVRKQLAPGYDVATHFTPRYDPWQQRLCLVPDGDLFAAIRSGRVGVVTDRVRGFTETGVELESGATLEADLVVTATGLTMQVLNGMALSVDGRALAPAELVNYKGAMFAGVPNLASVFGYVDASWTLKADLTAVFVCRLLAHMRATSARMCVPMLADPAMPLAPWAGLSSGYFERAFAHLPKQGTTRPWKLNGNYLADLMTLRYRRVDDGVLAFS